MWSAVVRQKAAVPRAGSLSKKLRLTWKVFYLGIGSAVPTRNVSLRSVYYCSELLFRTREQRSVLSDCGSLRPDPRSCQLLDWFEDHAACCQEDRGLSLREDAALLEEDPVQQATEVATAWEPDTDTPPRTPTLRQADAEHCRDRQRRNALFVACCHCCLRPPSPPTADDFTPEAVPAECGLCDTCLPGRMRRWSFGDKRFRSCRGVAALSGCSNGHEGQSDSLGKSCTTRMIWRSGA